MFNRVQHHTDYYHLNDYHVLLLFIISSVAIRNRYKGFFLYSSLEDTLHKLVCLKHTEPLKDQCVGFSGICVTN